MNQLRTLTAFGVTLPIVDWARRTGISRQLIRGRQRLGWPEEMIVIMPAGARVTILDKTVAEIRERRRCGEEYETIARACCVSRAQAQRIAGGTARKVGRNGN